MKSCKVTCKLGPHRIAAAVAKETPSRQHNSHSVNIILNEIVKNP